MWEVFNLRSNREFNNSKIKIKYTVGSISKDISVYLYDEEGGRHHVYWNISPDRCSQSFSKINKKIEDFVITKVKEWLTEQKVEDAQREEANRIIEDRYQTAVQSLIDNF